MKKSAEEEQKQQSEVVIAMKEDSTPSEHSIEIAEVESMKKKESKNVVKNLRSQIKALWILRRIWDSLGLFYMILNPQSPYYSDLFHVYFVIKIIGSDLSYMWLRIRSTKRQFVIIMFLIGIVDIILWSGIFFTMPVIQGPPFRLRNLEFGIMMYAMTLIVTSFMIVQSIISFVLALERK